ncbi:MAG: peroxiredoxin [Deltaproteobacteria bacterium RIFOXYD12_FULL_57_12]|nr:MAG: peroxiredoxin [Deltaproteobacteria bacterium RIFOXYD12_FULL_57_12]
MAKSLGIFVTNPNNMKHVMGVAKAATAKGSKVKIFFTWKGTLLCKDPSFPALCKIADVYICADSYKKMGYDPINDIPEGLTEKKMSTQSSHGDILTNYECYMTL